MRLMRISTRNSVRLSPLFLAAVLAAGGCASSKPQPAPWNVSITRETPAPIEVDLIGVTEAEKPFWAGCDLDKYWTLGDPLRRQQVDKLSMTLKSNQPAILQRDDPKWKDWLSRGATDLLIIANFPGQFTPGPTDPRRKFLPLDKKSWDAKNQTLEIRVQDTLIRVQTPQKPRR